MNTSLLFLFHLYVLSFKLGLSTFQAVQVAIAAFYRLWTNPVSAMHSLINFLLKEQTSKYILLASPPKTIKFLTSSCSLDPTSFHFSQLMDDTFTLY